MMFMTRVRLWASTCSAISVATLGRRFIREWVAPILIQCAEGMFGRLATLAHGLRVLIEALLYGLQDVFMLPACNPSLLASGAALFDSAQSSRCSRATVRQKFVSGRRNHFITVSVCSSKTEAKM